jgi:hypothetical protein
MYALSARSHFLSSKLVTLRKTAIEHSIPEPTSTCNYAWLPHRGGLVKCAEYCHQHDFETHDLVLAKEQNWPTTVDSEVLAGCVISLKDLWSDIIEDQNASEFLINSKLNSCQWEA